MKLLFDQNISYKLVKNLQHIYPDSLHVNLLGLSKSNDIEIWNHARNSGLTIVTHDVDFSELSVVKGSPPKIIWLRCGNNTTKHIEKLLIEHHRIISDFIKDTNVSVLQIF